LPAQTSIHMLLSYLKGFDCLSMYARLHTVH